MAVTSAALFARLRVLTCLVGGLCVSGAVVGCGTSAVNTLHPHNGHTSSRTVSTASVSTTQAASVAVVSTSSHVAAPGASKQAVGPSTVSPATRRASLAAARRAAAAALSTARKSAAIRDARRAAKHVSRRTALAVKRRLRRVQLAAERAAKQVKAKNPAGCLKRASAVADSKAAARTHSKAQLMRVRRLVLGCLNASRAASRPAATVPTVKGA
jgi:hypothetical protein